MEPIYFSVDSRLLRELGERLVGRPHIALAELIKNSYDADATLVSIVFGDDWITITDNGHGMSRRDFKERWMRIGSTHKERQGTSPDLGRPLTGSKGVGRLSVQLLADHLELRSRIASDTVGELKAVVDWTDAVEAGLLTTAKADVSRVKRRQNDSRTSGVSMKLTGLHQVWDTRAIEKLGEQIWPLQPPFRTDDERDFVVRLSRDGSDSDDDLAAAFSSQMTAVLELWTARIRGRLLPAGVEPSGDAGYLRNPDISDERVRTAPRVLELTTEFAGQHPVTQQLVMDDCHIDELAFELRVFNLINRQPRGVSVVQARQYLNAYGGVHVYDAGFHLPYYGPESDWLRIERDHAHRRSASDYLPKELQVAGGAEYVPTNSRLYGTVQVSTTHELAAANESERRLRKKKSRQSDTTYPITAQEALRIQVTRDRLVDTIAYRNLVTLVRSSVDVYAMLQAKQVYDVAVRERSTAAPSPRRVEDLAQTLRRHRSRIPDDVYEDLETKLADTTESIRAEYEERNAQTGLLASLATAGVSALAYEHEVGKQFAALDSIAKHLRTTAATEAFADGDFDTVADDIEQWVRRARATRALFTPLLDTTNRETRQRLKARATVREVFGQVSPLMRGADLVNEVPRDLRLPLGSFAEWSALLQNLCINAANAMLDSDTRLLRISAHTEGSTRHLDVEDTGVGIDLAEAPSFFEPFKRRSRVSDARAELGLGGTGLGLTIVAMLADELGCGVEFVPPSDGFMTCARITWEEDDD